MTSWYHVAILNRAPEEHILRLLRAGTVDVHEHGLDPYAGWRPLHWAAAHNHARAVRALLAAHADVSTRTAQGMHTPLHLAASHGALAAVKELLAAGASLDVLNKMGQTPRQVASNPAVAEVLAAGHPPRSSTGGGGYGRSPIGGGGSMGSPSVIGAGAGAGVKGVGSPRGGVVSSSPSASGSKNNLVVLPALQTRNVARGSAAVVAVQAGQVVRVRCLGEGALAELMMWTQHRGREEYLSVALTRARGHAHLHENDRLWSCLPHARPMATLIDDTAALHAGGGDRHFGGSVRRQADKAPAAPTTHRHCLQTTPCMLAGSDACTRATHAAFMAATNNNNDDKNTTNNNNNIGMHEAVGLFSSTHLDGDRWVLGRTGAGAGDSIDLMALMDVHVGVAACTHGAADVCLEVYDSRRGSPYKHLLLAKKKSRHDDNEDDDDDHNTNNNKLNTTNGSSNGNVQASFAVSPAVSDTQVIRRDSQFSVDSDVMAAIMQAPAEERESPAARQSTGSFWGAAVAPASPSPSAKTSPLQPRRPSQQSDREDTPPPRPSMGSFWGAAAATPSPAPNDQEE